MPTRNVVLTEHQAKLVAGLVRSGSCQNANEVMREAAHAGIADIAAGRFRTFDTAEALDEHLSGLCEAALDSLPPKAGSDR